MTMSIRDIDIDDNDISSKIKILSSLVVSLLILLEKQHKMPMVLTTVVNVRLILRLQRMSSLEMFSSFWKAFRTPLEVLLQDSDQVFL